MSLFLDDVTLHRKAKRISKQIRTIFKKKSRTLLHFFVPGINNQKVKLNRKIMAEKDIKNHKNAFLTSPEIITALY